MKEDFLGKLHKKPERTRKYLLVALVTITMGVIVAAWYLFSFNQKGETAETPSTEIAKPFAAVESTFREMSESIKDGFEKLSNLMQK